MPTDSVKKEAAKLRKDLKAAYEVSGVTTKMVAVEKAINAIDKFLTKLGR